MITPARANTNEQPTSLDEWARRAQMSIYAHNLAAAHFSRRNGIVNAISLGGVVAIGQVALVADLSSDFAKAVVAVLTVALAILGALALLWDFRAKALEHRFAARQYGMIRRALEALEATDPVSDEAAWRRDELRRLWDVASSTAPGPPERLRAKAREMYDERNEPRLGAGLAAPATNMNATPPQP